MPWIGAAGVSAVAGTQAVMATANATIPFALLASAETMARSGHCMARSRVAKSLMWVHAPKCGSSFANTIFHFDCPNAPSTAHAAFEADPTWPPDGLKEHWNKTNCVQLSYPAPGIHAPASAGHMGRLVAMFREPQARIRSCLQMLAEYLNPPALPGHDASVCRAGSPTGLTASQVAPRLKVILSTHGFFPDQFLDALLRANCSLPVDYLISLHTRISGVQTKLALGMDASTDVASSHFRDKFREEFRDEFREWPGGLGGGAPPGGHPLRRFAFVGLVEQWPASICLFHKIFGGPLQPVELLNSRPASMREARGSASTVSHTLIHSLVRDHLDDTIDTFTYLQASRRFYADIRTHFGHELMLTDAN